MIATGPQTRESVPWARVSRWEAQSPRRKPRQEALRNLGSAERGLSETLRLGRGEKPLPSKSNSIHMKLATSLTAPKDRAYTFTGRAFLRPAFSVVSWPRFSSIASPFSSGESVTATDA